MVYYIWCLQVKLIAFFLLKIKYLAYAYHSLVAYLHATKRAIGWVKHLNRLTTFIQLIVV